MGSHRIIYLVAGLLFLVGIAVAILLPPDTYNPCVVRNGQVIRGCLLPVEENDRLGLRLAIGAVTTLALLGLVWFGHSRGFSEGGRREKVADNASVH